MPVRWHGEMTATGRSLLLANKYFTVDPHRSQIVSPETFERVVNTEHLFTKEVFNHFINYDVCYNKATTQICPGTRRLGLPLVLFSSK